MNKLVDNVTLVVRHRSDHVTADPWNDFSDRILATLRSANSMTASEIAQAVGVDLRKVQETLIDLDDQERVHMRNGWYALSASERAKRG